MITALLLWLMRPALKWCERPQPGHRVPTPNLTAAAPTPWAQRQRRRIFPPRS